MKSGFIFTLSLITTLRCTRDIKLGLHFYFIFFFQSFCTSPLCSPMLLMYMLLQFVLVLCWFIHAPKMLVNWTSFFHGVCNDELWFQAAAADINLFWGQTVFHSSAKSLELFVSLCCFSDTNSYSISWS